MTGGTLTAALSYAGRYGWRIFPMTVEKRPLTQNGRSDASLMPEIILGWWQRWPGAVDALATGPESGVVVIDVDIDGHVDGRDALEALGVISHPDTRTSHSPSGGYHLFFQHPGFFVKTIAGKLGSGLDIRGDGGSAMLPPGPGRYWDPHLDLDTPLAEFPAWAIIPAEPERKVGPRPGGQPLTRYGEAALDNAVKRIIGARAGEQEQTLNLECYSIGTLVGGGVIPSPLVLEALEWAARQIPSHDPRRPWSSAQLDRKVRESFLDGIAHPRVAA